MNSQSDLSRSDSIYDMNSEDVKEHSVSRNISFGNPNYDYFLEVYSTNANRELMTKQKRLSTNNQLFNKRVNMFTKNKLSKKANNIRKMNNSARSGLRTSGSMSLLTDRQKLQVK